MAEHKDLFVIREYVFYGIVILVEINSVAKTVSLVEFDKSNDSYKPKRWLFAERGLEYMNGWLNILAAMQAAVEAGKVELQRLEDEEAKLLTKILANDLGKKQ